MVLRKPFDIAQLSDAMTRLLAAEGAQSAK
jgi:hypothetical protein